MDLGFRPRRVVLLILSGILLLALSGWIAEFLGHREQAFLVAFIAIVVFAGGRAFILDRLRDHALHKWADSEKFVPLSGRLPALFPVRETPFASTRTISNSYGFPGVARDAFFFDCRTGSGEARRSHTVIAWRGEVAELGYGRFGPDLVTEQLPGWAYIYSDAGLLELSELQRLVAEIGAL
jgi:hypothetical protein